MTLADRFGDAVNGLLLLSCLAAAGAPSAAAARTILVFGPHPDDEALLAAGRVRDAVAAGDLVKVVVVTNGDFAGTSSGYLREGESVAAAQLLGLTEQDVIFLGYGDASLNYLYESGSGTQVFTSSAGQTSTYGNRGLGGMDYHRYRTGSAGPYNRDTLLGDLEALLRTYRPDEVYTVTHFDEHADHHATALFVTEALVALKRSGLDLRTKLYQSLIWAPTHGCTDSNWPYLGGFTPGRPFIEPQCLGTTQLEWARLQHFAVPAEMQVSDPAANLKFRVIDRYQSQTVPWLLAFARKDEFFWLTDFGTDVALTAQVRVSSENAAIGQTGLKAIDGVLDGEPRRAANEWATLGQTAGAWIELSFGSAVTVGQVNLFDRPNPSDNVLSGRVSFSDGSSVAVGALPPDGKVLPVVFAPRTVTWLRFTVDGAQGTNTGLSELQALGAPVGTTGLPPYFVEGPLPAPAQIDSSQTCTVTVAANDLLGGPLRYLWSAEAGSISGNGATAVFTPPPVTAETWLTLTSTVLNDRGGSATNVTFVLVTPGSGGGSPTGENLARSAGVTVSSQNAATGQEGGQAIDGMIDGWPGDYTREWATMGELAGAWIQLEWVAPISVGQVKLYDRPNLTDNVLAGTLLFGDGSSVEVAALPGSGTGAVVSFPARVTRWLRFRVDQAQGWNVGLAEIEVFGGAAGSTALTVSPAAVIAGATAQGTVTLANPAPAGGASVPLSSSDAAAATVPASVTVPPGATSATFMVSSLPVAADATVSITASFEGGPKSAVLTVSPLLVSSLSLLPASVLGGSPVQGSVALNGTAGPAGAVIELSTSIAALAAAPTRITIPAGASSGSFSIATSAVASVATVTVAASYGSSGATAALTLNPVALSALSLAPATLAGGTSSLGTVTLNGPAPGGGAVVALSSSSQQVADVPASITVAAGATTATFTVTTAPVTSTTAATLWASYGGASGQASLTVTPAGVGLNLAETAVITVSSQNTATGQQGIKATDGIVAGYPGDYTKEWATLWQLAGAWIQLDWVGPVTLGQVKLYDRPNLTDNVLAGTLLFSDGSSVAVGPLPDDGAELTVTFPARTVGWMQLRVDEARGFNIGLSEIRVSGP